MVLGVSHHGLHTFYVPGFRDIFSIRCVTTCLTQHCRPTHSLIVTVYLTFQENVWFDSNIKWVHLKTQGFIKPLLTDSLMLIPYRTCWPVSVRRQTVIFKLLYSLSPSEKGMLADCFMPPPCKIVQLRNFTVIPCKFTFSMNWTWELFFSILGHRDSPL